jgi:group I intron endonuclease
MIGIYMFENINNHKKYIGQSINIIHRKWEHYNRPSSGCYIDKILAAKPEEFTFSIIEECPVEKLDEREIYWIDYYDSIQNGYNVIRGGDCYRGENNIQAKLTEKQVKEIIKLLEECKITSGEIAKQYQVHINTIEAINRCKTWCYLHSYNKNIRQESLNKRKYIRSTNQGDGNHCAKITESQALQMIELLKYDSRSIAQLSRDFNISLSILYDINKCKTWTYLHNYKENVRNEARKEVVPV